MRYCEAAHKQADRIHHLSVAGAACSPFVTFAKQNGEESLRLPAECLSIARQIAPDGSLSKRFNSGVREWRLPTDRIHPCPGCVELGFGVAVAVVIAN